MIRVGGPDASTEADSEALHAECKLYQTAQAGCVDNPGTTTGPEQPFGLVSILWSYAGSTGQLIVHAQILVEFPVLGWQGH